MVGGGGEGEVQVALEVGGPWDWGEGSGWEAAARVSFGCVGGEGGTYVRGRAKRDCEGEGMMVPVEETEEDEADEESSSKGGRGGGSPGG